MSHKVEVVDPAVDDAEQAVGNLWGRGAVGAPTYANVETLIGGDLNS